MIASESCYESPRRIAIWTVATTQALAAVGNVYCRVFHKAISRPVNGKYRCWKCLREFDLGW